jgi:hypothetical protein
MSEIPGRDFAGPGRDLNCRLEGDQKNRGAFEKAPRANVFFTG